MIKKILQFIVVVIISITLFLLLPNLFNKQGKGFLDFTTKELSEAVFLGIVTPSAIIISRKIKNNFLFVLLVILFIAGILAGVKFLFA